MLVGPVPVPFKVGTNVFVKFVAMFITSHVETML